MARAGGTSPQVGAFFDWRDLCSGAIYRRENTVVYQLALEKDRWHVKQLWQSMHSVLFFPANLFLLISSIVGSKMAGPHTQFVQSFMEECVDCLEQGSRGSILQFMPFTMVSYERGGEEAREGKWRGEAGWERRRVTVASDLIGKGLQFILKCWFCSPQSLFFID